MSMPGGSVLEAIPQLRKEAPDTRIVMLTMQEASSVANAALRAGAVAYVLKDAAHDELFHAIRRAAGGQRYVSRDLASRLALERIRTPRWD
jgi:DNA-binding NarL/FixJ family response regulator